MAVTSRTALIAGAGIGGLAAGLALRRAGWTVRLFERASSPRELGFDLMLASNAMAALQELGVAERVRATAAIVESMSITAGPGARPRRGDLAPVPRSLRPLIVPRHGLHGALLEAMGAESITFGALAVDFSVDRTRVALHLANGRTVDGDVLIGADGVGSAIRKRLHPSALPHRRPLVAIRGVAHDAGHLVDVGLAMAFASGVDGGVLRGLAGTVFWFLTVSQEELDGRSNRSVADRYTRAFGEPFESVARATRDADLRTDVLIDADPLAHWGHGPVTLLGDAAHPMLPHAGQGAAQALEDAVALGLALGAEVEPQAGLRRYEAVRVRRTARVVRFARALAFARTTSFPVVTALRGAAIRWGPLAALHLTRLYRPGDPHAALRRAARSRDR
jgi:2-polyprenyl-6-methoxyphenol hydroxylase-like FAD-dependent oxidoreductase